LYPLLLRKWLCSVASMRVYSQQYAFVFSFIVFRTHIIVGNSFENKLVKTRCASISHTVDNYVIAIVYIKLFTAIIIPSLSRRTPYTVSIILFFPPPLRKSPMYSWPSRPKCCDNVLRPSDVCIWCWTDVVNESFVVSKTSSSFIDSAVSIVVCSVDVIAGRYWIHHIWRMSHQFMRFA